MLSRRNFLKIAAGAVGYALLPGKGWVSLAQVVPLDPALVPKFVNPLPSALDPFFVFTEASPGYYEINMAQISQNVLGPGFGNTTLWGYGNAAVISEGPTFPGRTFVVQRDQQVQVKWINNLPNGHLLPIDPTLHWADPLHQHASVASYNGPIPIVPHVHGGHTESASDGLPEYWWTPGEAITGPRFVKSTYTYDNDQEAATLWYHDHALGITRLNVYAGMAGFYIVRDANDTGLPTTGASGLPTAPYEIPIVIQDRMFTADGELFMPTVPQLLPNGLTIASVLPEFFGNVIVVNGVAWPVLDVEPRKYRFRLLNGSDSRFYNMRITGTPSGPPFIQIGTDNGLLYQPVPVNQLTIGPGERADVVVDFAGFQGQTLIVRNNARSPFDKGVTVNPQLDGQIMAFRVSQPLNGMIPDKPLPVTLRSAPITPSQAGTPVRTRKLLLFEGTDSLGRLQPMLGVAEPTQAVDGSIQDGTLLWDEVHSPITENPNVGDTEIWEIFNTTMDAHPIHLHLVSFQILSRQKFRGTIVPKDNIAHDGSVSLGGMLTNIRLQGQPKPPEPNEIGWKDTAQMFPGEVTRIVAKFDRPGRYVWHCHILSHEDHEMMRPYHVGPLLDSINLLCTYEGATITDQAVLCWQAVQHAPAYQVHIATSSSFADASIVRNYSVQDGLTQITTDLAPGTYYWRVRVIGNATVTYEGAWSATDSFTLE